MRQLTAQPRVTLSPRQREVLAQDSWFGNLPGQRQSMLLAEARPLRFRHGARLYGVGDPPNGLWAVVEGQVRLMAYPISGAEIPIRLLGPGVWCGELSTLDGQPRPHDAVSSGPTFALNVPLAAFVALAEREPGLWRDIALLGCAHQREALNFIGRRMALPPAQRLIRSLLDACSNAGTNTPAVRQSDLAVIVGVSRQTLNRYLRALEREGVVCTGYGRIEVLDIVRLKRLGGQSE